MAEVFSMPNNFSQGSIAELQNVYKNADLRKLAMDEARGTLLVALQNAMRAEDLPQKELLPFVVEVPADTSHGDLAANIAMVSAREFGMPPRKIAEAIVANLPPAPLFSKVEIAGPGFINLFLAPAYFCAVVMAACATGQNYGRTLHGGGKKINVEFVSANPTGPMHLGNARGAALGDGLSEAMAWAGYDVTREFYINDAGNQIVKFGSSLAARYLQIVRGPNAVEFPEDGYQGDDIRERAQEYFDIHGGEDADLPTEELAQKLVGYALPKNIEGLEQDLEKYRVHYDVWFRESTLHASGAVEKTIEQLRSHGAIYESEGAIWYKGTLFGDEKDEVLVRANGIPTYFAADIAYHADKFNRGFATAIDVWGADHHGHVARMKGAMEALGYGGNNLDIVIMQFVRLVQGGKPVRMSKRTGKAITLTDLLNEVPIDSARFFFNMREPGSQIEFDLDLAVKTDSDNPVYYVQYAHARICSIVRALAAEGIELNESIAFANLDMLQEEAERTLIRHIGAFPGEIVGAATSYDPARITRYVTEAATLFHKFYSTCRVKGEENNLLQARLALCIAAKTVLANALGMLKITVPKKM